MSDVPHAALYMDELEPCHPQRMSVETRHIIFTPAPYEREVPEPRWLEDSMQRRQRWRDLVEVACPKESSMPVLSGEIRFRS